MIYLIPDKIQGGKKEKISNNNTSKLISNEPPSELDHLVMIDFGLVVKCHFQYINIQMSQHFIFHPQEHQPPWKSNNCGSKWKKV